MRLRILLFGPYAAAMGAGHVELAWPGDRAPTPAGVLLALGETFAALRPILPHARLAVNSSYAKPADPIGPSDELALIGLVGGG